ncbi:MAG: ABC transporter ATP-binding protein [Treponema sp.]|jgi:ABC-type nitrate/sulfonate/bicarbonate transport system ATPase subunit|nr:ABC transporter ATP-binding protein [Treponema sp.]
MRPPELHPPGISIRRLEFGYGASRIFGGLNLELGEENPVVILGPSGCGKTTLLFLIAGLRTPSGGSIVIRDNGPGGPPGSLSRFAHKNPQARQSAAPQAALVFQEPRLLPWMTALENTALPLLRPLGKQKGRERALHFLDLAGLADKAGSLPPELSGGQRQRVNLARAFAFPSPVILLDEAFQSLDIPLKIAMMDLVMTMLNREQGRLVVAVTHDPREAVYLGRRIIVLGRGGDGTVPVLDEVLNTEAAGRSYGSPAQAAVEQRLLAALRG